MKLLDLINGQQTLRSETLALQRFIFEDAYDSGRGWTGPNPVDPTTKQEILTGDLISRQFVSEDLLAEVIERHVMGVLSNEPSWQLISDNTDLRKEAEDALTVWWDESDAMVALQDATRYLTYAKEVSSDTETPRPSVGILRMFVKSQSVVNGKVPKRATLEEALGDIGIHAAEPYNSGVVRNLDGDPLFGYYTYPDEDNNILIEVNGVRKYLLDLEFEGLPPGKDEDTVVAIINQNGEIEAAASYPLEGNIMMFEARRFPPLITEAAIRQQKAINKTLTMMNHNTDVGGFTERTILNAQMPGKWVDKDGKTTTSELGVAFVPDALRVGAGTTNFYAGLEEVDEEGNVRYAKPSIHYRDPTNPLAFVRTLQGFEERLYASVHQLHILISGDATASGKSRIQATNDFMSSLQKTAGQVQAMTRWMLSSMLSLAAVLMQEPRRYVALRPVAEAKLSAVQLSSIDIQAIINKRNEGLISTETAMHEVGVEDVDAEKILIEKEQALREQQMAEADERDPETGEPTPDQQRQGQDNPPSSRRRRNTDPPE